MAKTMELLSIIIQWALLIRAGNFAIWVNTLYESSLAI